MAKQGCPPGVKKFDVRRSLYDPTGLAVRRLVDCRSPTPTPLIRPYAIVGQDGTYKTPIPAGLCGSMNKNYARLAPQMQVRPGPVRPGPQAVRQPRQESNGRLSDAEWSCRKRLGSRRIRRTLAETSLEMGPPPGRGMARRGARPCLIRSIFEMSHAARVFETNASSHMSRSAQVGHEKAPPACTDGAR